jgi:hypothetical protein
MDRGKSIFEGPGSPKRDAFLAYNSVDSRLVRSIADRLKIAGLKPWFDEDDVVLGRESVDQMTQGLKQSGCAVFFLGEGGFGTWQGGLEYHLAVVERVKHQRRVFAVLLPGGPDMDSLPEPLQIGANLDLRGEFVGDQLSEDGFLRLRAGVEGISAGKLSERESRQAPTSPADDAPASNPAPGRRRAMLVGISDYGPQLNGRLHGPLTDIDRLADALRALETGPGESWLVESLADLTKDQMSNELRTFFSREAPENDTLLFYFSGEGLVDQIGGSYLCTIDTDPDEAYDTAISAAQVRTLVSRCPAHEKIVILDCCRGKPLTADPYSNLGKGIAVFGASVGEERAARSAAELSPFTEALLAAMRAARSPDRATLTVGDLLDALSIGRRSLWANDGLDRDIVLATRARTSVPQEAETTDTFNVSITSVQGIERLPMLRQLSATLDSLLTVADDRRKIPCAVVRETIRLLGNELAILALGERRDELTREASRRDRQSPMRVSLAFDPGTIPDLFDLPWEYVGFSDPVLAPGVAIPPAMRDLQPVERLVQGSRTKQAGNARPQQGVLFCSLQPDSPQSDRHALLESFELQYQRTKPPLRLDVVRQATWHQFRTNPLAADLVILQARIKMGEGMAQIGFASRGGELEDTREDDLLNTLALRRPLTWLVVEAIAEHPDWQTPLAARRLAHQFAKRCERNVVAICHPPAYHRCVRDRLDEDTFLDHLVRNLASGSPVGQAAHEARQEALAALQVDGSVIGIPIVIRPEWRSEPTASDTTRVPSTPSAQRFSATAPKAESPRPGGDR